MRVGLFDSGVGGLSVLEACKREVPAAEYLYLDDRAHLPYGGKTRAEITEIADRNLRVLFAAGCDVVIIACNTATAAAANTLRARYPQNPILGLEPAVKPALAQTRGRVLLLATPVTAGLKRYPPRVIVGVEHTLASEIEEAYGNPEALRALAERTLAAYDGYEAVVTGCSHYAHLIPYMHCPVFDGAAGVAKRLKSLIGG